jgi:class 3 adenylate cyclase
MPLYLDRHDATGAAVDPREAYAAHLLDLEIQKKYDTRYMTYWLDPEKGAAFCLVDAPSKEAAESVHRESHGSVASEIIEVEEAQVIQFLGRISDPLGTSIEKPIAESAFRTIVFTDIEGSTNLTHRLGDEGVMALLREHDGIVRSAVEAHGGREIKHTGDGIMASFAGVTTALDATILIQRSLLEHNQAHKDAAVHVRVGLSAGEPVCDGSDLFGAAVIMARRICDAAEPGCIFTSNVIRELAIGKKFTFRDRGEAQLKGFDEPIRLHELNWRGE